MRIFVLAHPHPGKGELLYHSRTQLQLLFTTIPFLQVNFYNFKIQQIQFTFNFDVCCFVSLEIKQHNIYMVIKEYKNSIRACGRGVDGILGLVEGEE